MSNLADVPPRASPSPSRRRGVALAIAAIAGVGVLSGCGGDDDRSAGTAATQQQRVTVDSCGEQLTFERSVQRVAILDPSLADTLSDLGVGDRIVATATGVHSPLPRLRAQLDGLPDIGYTLKPSTEALLKARPDLVFADQAGDLSGAQGGATVAKLQAAGIPSYIAAGGCGGDVSNESGGLDRVFADIDALGAVFDVPDRAKALNARLRARLDAIHERIPDQPRVRTIQLSIVSGQLYATSGGIGGDILARAGADNPYADAGGTFATVSAEQITARNPQAFILTTFAAKSGKDDDTVDYLKRTFPTTDAVRDGRLLVQTPDTTGATGSTRLIANTEEIARFLYPDAFTSP